MIRDLNTKKTMKMLIELLKINIKLLLELEYQEDV